MPPDPNIGPLIIGSRGRVGQAFRALVAAGAWPGALPVWHSRSGVDGDYGWDMSGPAPVDPCLGHVTGMIVLAGGTGSAGQDSTALALAALRLARDHGIGPVLLCSSQAVYGRASGAQGETADLHPANAYGAAKVAMERAVVGQNGACCLRIGNVAGCDMLLTNAGRGPVRLDRFGDGSGPLRCYIGPLSLARTMVALIAAAALPPILNVAAPGEVAMADLLRAAGADWSWTPAPDDALPRMALDTALLQALAPLTADAATPATLLTEARTGGWRIAR